jgi:hypothetical protein
MENNFFEDLEGEGSIILRGILGRETVGIKGGQNWLKIVFNGAFWNWQC